MPVSISGAGSISGLDQGFNITSGSVGVGTDNPTQKLEVLGSTLLKGTTSTATALMIKGAGTQGDDATISFTNGYTQTFKIGMSDDIGPARDFIISETSTGSSSDNENPKYIFNGNGDGIFQITDRAGGDINVQLATSGISYLNGGNFGINTTNPATKLDVRPTAEDPTTGSPAAGSFLQIRADDATVGKGPNLALMNLSGSKETGWRLSALTTSGNNGDFTIHGYGGGATYSERLRILSSGGITFNGDTAAANALDDYEEGTFTPSAYGGVDNSSGGTPTYTTQVGRYTKVGNKVFCDIYIRFGHPARSTGSRLEISGLPFPISNTYYGSPSSNFTRGGGLTTYTNLESAVGQFYGTANTNRFWVYKDGDSSFVAGGSNDVAINGKYLIGVFQYHTDS